MGRGKRNLIDVLAGLPWPVGLVVGALGYLSLAHGVPAWFARQGGPLALSACLPKESVADKELSALLAGNRLVPIVHNTTYEALRNVSPLLASRSGLGTAQDSMIVVAEKIAELVAI